MFALAEFLHWMHFPTQPQKGSPRIKLGIFFYVFRQTCNPLHYGASLQPKEQQYRLYLSDKSNSLGCNINLTDFICTV